ncbi:MAG: LpqB family beta-propeller domain-containing protein [Georgenia sp.]
MGPDRRRRALVTALAAAVALAGCASLPRTGPVTASKPELPAAQGIGLYARGPEAGAEPEAIVEGFLAASAAGYSDEFLVAREFLAGAAVQTWQPLAQVRVFDEVPEYSRTATGAVQLSVDTDASVDSAGRYDESAPGSTIEADFTLARVGGEWRIIDLDDGVFLPAANFLSVYTQTPLYFLTPDKGYFVPDVRWFPRQNLATSLVRNLLTGPSPWLAAGAVSMIPPGTRMSVESVAVTDGVAAVDLSADALVADEDRRALLFAQIERTLRGVSGVQDVALTAAGAPVELTVPVPELPTYPFGAANAVVIADGVPADVVAGVPVPRPGAALMTGVDPHHPALGYEGVNPTLVFLQGTDRLVSAPTAEVQPFLLAQGPGLVPPSIDQEGWIWTSPTPSDGHLTAVRPDGTRVEVGAPWLAGGKIHTLRISREGARAVVVWESAGVLAIDLTTVVRGLDGTPRTLGDPVRIGERMTSATELAWVDEQTVAVLGTSEGNPDLAVHLLSLGGPSTRLPAVAGAVTMTAGRGDRSILVGTEDNRVYERNGASWRPVLDGVTYPTLPG